MNRREKILAVLAGSTMAALLLYGLAYSFVLKPARRQARQARKLRKQNSELKNENLRLSRDKPEFAALRGRTFADTTRRASVLVGARINQLAAAAGLSEGDYAVTGFSDRHLKDAGRELACTITAKSSPERMVNFLYVLGRDQHLHRVTNLTINPQRDRRLVSFALRYATPVLKDPGLAGIASRPTTQPVRVARLNDPRRAVYDVIARRQVLLPYIRMVRREVVRAQPPRPEVRQEAPRPQPQPAWYDQMVLVGLPAVGEQAEVHLAMPDGNVGKPLKVGQTLPFGRIAMVDYRVLPMPTNPKELSPSRLILKIGRDYWAVELGEPLSQRRVLRRNDLPNELKGEAATSRPTTTQRAAKTFSTKGGPEQTAGANIR